MIATFSFLLKIPVTAVSFHWHNDTPSFFCHLTELSQNQFVLEIVSPLPCSSGLVHHTLLFVYFFSKNSFHTLAALTSAHQRFQRLDFYCCYYYLSFSALYGCISYIHCYLQIKLSCTQHS